jgi:hypothetical protein
VLTDPALREWAWELRQGGQWLTVVQVAQRMHVEPATVADWIRKERLAATRWKQWWVWSGDLDGFVLPTDHRAPRPLFPERVPARLLAILDATPQSASALSVRLRANRSTVRGALCDLQRRGLAQKDGTRNGGWVRT